MFYLSDVSRSPLSRPRSYTFDEPISPEYLVPVYQRRDHVHPSSSFSLSRRWSLPAVTVVRPRLSHRYSRGLLGARGKMRQVVVRSRSPGTREIRLLFSPPLHPSVHSLAHSLTRSAPFIRAGILCARVSDACVCPSRQDRYIFLLDDRAKGPINGCPLTRASGRIKSEITSVSARLFYAPFPLDGLTREGKESPIEKLGLRLM